MCRDGTVHIHCFTHAQVRDVKNRICEPSVEIGVMTVLTAPEESSHAEERVVYVVGTVSILGQSDLWTCIERDERVCLQRWCHFPFVLN